MIKLNTVFFILLSVLFNPVFAQNEDIDASKPTNLYTQVNTAFEYQNHSSCKALYGSRVNIQYTFNPDNLLLAELPLLYNSKTEAFGLSDSRLRYFHVAKRNLSKTVIALAPFADISVPTGKFNNGLGSSSWSISGGMVLGLVLTPKIALFPGLSYVHITAPSAYTGDSQNGISMQTNVSLQFNKRAFLFINPVLTLLKKTMWSGEFNFNYMAKPNKLKLNIGYYPLFTQEVHTLRAGATFYI